MSRFAIRCGFFLLALASASGRAGEEAITYTKDIAPILYKDCVVCHRPGEVAPFSLLDYQDAAKRAKMIARVTKKHLMPPWKPQPGFGEFLNERRLSDAQIATITKWVENGAPEGNASDLPPAPKFSSGWTLGPPDLVVKVSEPFTIRAEGNDVYRNFVLPLDIQKDTFIRGIEVRPGNRRVAHHAISLLDASGAARKLDENSPGPGYAGLGGFGFLPAGMLPGYVPGQIPRFFAEGTSTPLKKGTDLVLQMHYHPSGKVEADQTEVGLYFTDQPPKRTGSGTVLGALEIDIPAGAKNHILTDSFVLPCDFDVSGIWAHMHMIGKEVVVWAELPKKGGEVPLLRINDWDFNWQDNYEYKEPVRLPKGTKIMAKFVFDNSEDNIRNPNNPPQRVLYGENSTDEMAGVILGGFTPKPSDNGALLFATGARFIDVTVRSNFSKAIKENTDPEYKRRKKERDEEKKKEK